MPVTARRSPPETTCRPATCGCLCTVRKSRDLVAHLDLGARAASVLSTEATDILGKCIPPHVAADSTTGLVLGYVQSGKTMSFTTVAALARDNGYPMVIVITGISNPLLDQSTRRLEQDLRLQNNRKWRLFRNPKLETARASLTCLPPGAISGCRITVERRCSSPSSRSTTNLRNLNRVLQQLDLATTPVLVIDDEADQAGLNTRAGQGVRRARPISALSRSGRICRIMHICSTRPRRKRPCLSTLLTFYRRASSSCYTRRRLCRRRDIFRAIAESGARHSRGRDSHAEHAPECAAVPSRRCGCFF